jgi:hypothetical protein
VNRATGLKRATDARAREGTVPAQTEASRETRVTAVPRQGDHAQQVAPMTQPVRRRQSASPPLRAPDLKNPTDPPTVQPHSKPLKPFAGADHDAHRRGRPRPAGNPDASKRAGTTAHPEPAHRSAPATAPVADGHVQPVTADPETRTTQVRHQPASTRGVQPLTHGVRIDDCTDQRPAAGNRHDDPHRAARVERAVARRNDRAVRLRRGGQSRNKSGRQEQRREARPPKRAPSRLWPRARQGAAPSTPRVSASGLV